MLRKLSFLLISAILLTGCGAPAMESDNAKPESATVCTEAAGVVTASEIPDTAPAEGMAQTVTDTGDICTAEYFTFTAQNSTVTDDSGLTLLIQNRTVPTFISGDPERSEWVNEVLDRIDRDYSTDSANLDTYAREFVSLNGTENFYSFSNYQQLGVARH